MSEPDNKKVLEQMEMDRVMIGIGFAEVEIKEAGKIVYRHIPVNEVYKKPSLLKRVWEFFNGSKRGR